MGENPKKEEPSEIPNNPPLEEPPLPDDYEPDPKKSPEPDTLNLRK
jgi:hypothetical protein